MSSEIFNVRSNGTRPQILVALKGYLLGRSNHLMPQHLVSIYPCNHQPKPKGQGTQLEAWMFNHFVGHCKFTFLTLFYKMLDFLNFAESAQEFWLSGMPQQHEKTGTGSCEPNGVSGHQAVWTSERPGYGTTSNSSVCPNTVLLDSWLKDFNYSSKGVSPTLSEISQKLFQVTSNDARVAPWPGFSAYQAEEPSSKFSCNTALCSYPTEEVAPNFPNAVEEEPGMLRLFGVNLINHTKSTDRTDKIPIGVGETLTRAACSYEDSGQLSALSKVTKDHTLSVSESPREIQSHQSSTARTRIKVQVLSFFLSLLVYFLNCTLIWKLFLT
jgi:hypothetical protein